MKVVGLITEYNPFHNGHRYHMEMAKQITGADTVIAIMSGNYVQRGTPAFMPKHLRCLNALQNGADMVVELPSLYALGSAELFAYGAVSLLDVLGCVDALCFGSECGSIQPLEKVATILAQEPPIYKNCLNTFLKSGLSFPASREKALSACFGTTVCPPSLLNTSNNILAVEYLKALIRQKSSIKPFTIERLGSSYRQEDLEGAFSSATSIRNHFRKNRSASRDFWETVSAHTPKNCLTSMEQNYHARFPLFEEDFSLLLRYRLLEEDAESLQRYLDVNSDIAHRIANCSSQFVSFSQFCQVLKTREITYTRICRILFHILLKITKEEAESSKYTPHYFIRVLGFQKDRKDLFGILKETSALPLVTNLSGYRTLSSPALRQAELEIWRDSIYESVITDKFGTPFSHPLQQQMVIL